MFLQESALFEQINGEYVSVSEDRAVCLVREMLDRRLRREHTILSKTDAAAFLSLQLGALEAERFVGLFLDSQNRLIEYVELFQGTIDQAAVYPREIAKTALRLNASALIVAHNHPSGHPEPSAADIKLTLVVKNALALIDVRLLDHIVVGGGSTISLAERGLV
jgi:DNA repair protein RadC